MTGKLEDLDLSEVEARAVTMAAVEARAVAMAAGKGGLKEELAQKMLRDGYGVDLPAIEGAFETIRKAVQGQAPMHSAFTGNRKERRRKASAVKSRKRRIKQ